MAGPNVPRTVELVQAFAWTCEDCGRDNFERGITLGPESIDLDELPDNLDPDPIREWMAGGGGGSFMMAPTQVTCLHCKTTFTTSHPSEPNDPDG